MTRTSLFYREIQIGLPLLCSLCLTSTPATSKSQDAGIVGTILDTLSPSSAVDEKKTENGQSVQSSSDPGSIQLHDSSLISNLEQMVTHHDNLDPIANENTPATADPVLMQIHRRLQELLEGQLISSEEIDRLFSVNLYDPEAIAQHIPQLHSELDRLHQLASKIKTRLQTPQQEIPPPIKPEIIDEQLVEPMESIAPTPPTQPTFPEPRGKKNLRRPTRWLDRYDAWQKYHAELVEYEKDAQRYEQNRIVFEQSLRDYLLRKDAQEKASVEYKKAAKEWTASVESLRKELGRELANAQLRMEIAEARREYLTTLNSWLSQMTAPALVAFAALRTDRSPIKQRSSSLTALDKAISSVISRLKTLSHRSEGGALVGFQVNRAGLVDEIEQLTQALEKRRQSVERLSLETLKLANSLEQNSIELHSSIMSWAPVSDRTQKVDVSFSEHLAEMRRGAKHVSLSLAGTNTDLAPTRLAEQLQTLLPSPQTLASVEDGTRAVSQIKTRLEELDALIDSERIERERSHQAYRREAVTILASLASDKAKQDAYSLSREMITDLITDLQNLRGTLSLWAKNKRDQLLDTPKLLQNAEGIFWLTRLVVAILLLLSIALLRQRISRFVVLGIRKMSKSSVFRNRIGALVRWAGLIETIGPTLSVGVTCYAVLALIGFDLPEIRFAEVAVRWLIIYALGGRIIVGLTQRVSRGRPAVISVSPKVASLLAKTYRRVGIMLAITVTIYDWSQQWLGAGLLSALVNWIAWFWVGIWGLWAAFAWRQTVGDALARNTSASSFLRQIGVWMTQNTLGGTLLCPLIASWVIVNTLITWIKGILAEEGFFSYLRAKTLLRRSRMAKVEDLTNRLSELPENYTREFPLYPIYDEESAVILPRTKIVESAADQINRWYKTKKDGSLVVVGEKGVGKTTFLSLLSSHLSDKKVIRYSLTRKLRDEQGLVKELSSAFAIEGAAHIGAVSAHLNNSDEQVILLDEAHNVFLRTVDGYDAYEALIRLVNFTSEKVFWVLVFNSFSWAFINESRRRMHYFRRLLFLPSWSREEIQELIVRRNAQSGFAVEFDEVLLDEQSESSRSLEVIDSAEGFFRLLWETSRGNPRVATHLWLGALTPVGNDKVRVGLFGKGIPNELATLDRELLFVLAAICQHENLSVNELREVLNVPIDFAGFAVRYLREYKMLEQKHTDKHRLTLAPDHYPEVMRLLRQNHLIFETETK